MPRPARGHPFRRYLHRLPILHLELLLRRTSRQCRARRRRQNAKCATTASPTAMPRLALQPVPKAPSPSRSSTIEPGSVITSAPTLPACPPPTTASPPPASRSLQISHRAWAVSTTHRVEPEHPTGRCGLHATCSHSFRSAPSPVLALLDSLHSEMGLYISAFASLGLAGLSPRRFHLSPRPPRLCLASTEGSPHQLWLSREVLTLSLFAGAAQAYAAMLLPRSALARCSRPCHGSLRHRGDHFLGPHLCGESASLLVQRLHHH